MLGSERSENGYRDYPEEAVATVKGIRLLLDSGLSSDDIRAIRGCLARDLSTEPECADARVLYERRLRSVQERIDTLTRTRDRIEHHLRTHAV